MANRAYKETVLELEQRRLRAKELEEKRRDDVYRQIPELEEIKRKISLTSFEITKALIHTNPEEAKKLVNELKESNMILREQEIYLLNKHGYDARYLKDVYTCPICEDRGFVDNKKCGCFQQLMIEKLYKLSNIRDIIKDENFETFDIQFFSEVQKYNGVTPRQVMSNNYKVAERFIAEFETVYKNLFMYGAVGLGKSFLCHCIAKDLLDRGHTVLYITAIDLFKILEAYKFRGDENPHTIDLIEYLTQAELLIIDDLGTEVTSQFTSSELFNIINKRHSERKHTIISTNIALNEIEKIYSHRLESRFLGNFELMQFVGEDIRLQKKFND